MTETEYNTDRRKEARECTCRCCAAGRRRVSRESGYAPRRWKPHNTAPFSGRPRQLWMRC